MAAPLTLLALLIEIAFGYPERLSRAIGHPVMWMGRLVSWLDRRLNRSGADPVARRRAGAATMLLERSADRAELGVQLAAEAVDHSDDRERDAGGDQAVFDGGGAGFILHETRNQILHQLNSVYTWLVELGSGLTGVLSTVTMRHPTVGGLRRS